MIEVINTATNKKITYDGKKLGGDAFPIFMAEALVRNETKLDMGDPYEGSKTASLDESPDVLMSVLRHAVAPEAPYAGFVKVTVNGQTMPSVKYDPRTVADGAEEEIDIDSILSEVFPDSEAAQVGPVASGSTDNVGATKGLSMDSGKGERAVNDLISAFANYRTLAYKGESQDPSAFANYRALRFKSEVTNLNAPEDEGILEKVGLINSQNPIVRAGETAVSIATPGDLSDVRRPVRSSIYEALTPGGGGGNHHLIRRGLGRAKRNQLRCPPGFEHGGQFTDKRLSTCGLRLFDLPGFGLVPIGKGPGNNRGVNPMLAETIRGVENAGETTIQRAADVSVPGDNTAPSGPNVQVPNAEGPAAAAAAATQNAAQAAASSTATPSSQPGPQLDISRIALINPTGELDTAKREASIKKAVAVAAEANSPDFGRLVRRDGTMLDNVVPVVRLADVRNSDDMDQGFLVTAISDPAKFAESEFQVLSAGLDGIVMATPDKKGFIRLERAGAGAGSIRGMRRRWGTLLREQDPSTPGAAFDQLVQEGGKKLKLSVQYPGLNDPLAMVQIQRGGAKRTVRKWVYFMFLSADAPLRPTTLKPWTSVGEEEK